MSLLQHKPLWILILLFSNLFTFYNLRYLSIFAAQPCPCKTQQERSQQDYVENDMPEHHVVSEDPTPHVTETLLEKPEPRREVLRGTESLVPPSSPEKATEKDETRTVSEHTVNDPPAADNKKHLTTQENKPQTHIILDAASLFAWNGTAAEYLSAMNMANDDDTPRLLHFTYFSPGLPLEQKSIPSKVKANIDGWRNMMEPEGYITILWDNQAMRQVFPDLAQLLQEIPTMSWVSNLARYHILEQYGGIYLDTDIVPIRSPDLLRDKSTFGTAWSVCERPNDLKQRTSTSSYIMNEDCKKCQKCKLVNNAVIAGPPHHAAFQSVIEESMKNTRYQLETNPTAKYKFEWTGPPVWTKAAKKHHVSIFHATLFYPCNWNTKKLCQRSYYENSTHVYGMHQWSGSWNHDMYRGPKLLRSSSQKAN